MKKILLLLIGGVLFMTTVTGCFNVLNKKSKGDIEELFSDFTGMFPMDDYDLLYDKEGDSSTLSEGDSGSWILSTNMYYKDGEKKSRVGVQLIFDKDYRASRGYFTIDESKYPIIYTDKKIQLTDESVNADIENELTNFKILFDFLSFDREYLDSLSVENYFYNDNVPLYGISYNLPIGDKNIEALKLIYPNFPYDSEEVSLEFEGTGSQWSTTGGVSVRVMFDKEGDEYFSTRMKFSNSEKFDELFIEE